MVKKKLVEMLKVVAEEGRIDRCTISCRKVRYNGSLIGNGQTQTGAMMTKPAISRIHTAESCAMSAKNSNCWVGLGGKEGEEIPPEFGHDDDVGTFSWPWPMFEGVFTYLLQQPRPDGSHSLVSLSIGVKEIC